MMKKFMTYFTRGQNHHKNNNIMKEHFFRGGVLCIFQSCTHSDWIWKICKASRLVFSLKGKKKKYFLKKVNEQKIDTQKFDTFLIYKKKFCTEKVKTGSCPLFKVQFNPHFFSFFNFLSHILRWFTKSLTHFAALFNKKWV